MKYNDGNPVGIEHPALFADHSLYDVSFHTGQREELTANIIADNILSQVDSGGRHYQVLKDISDHSADGSELKRSGGFIISCDRNLHPKKTNRG